MKMRTFIASAIVACTGLAAFAGAAQAEVLKFTLNDGRANLGDQQGVHIIDPAVPDAPAVLTTSYTPGTGAFTAPATGLSFPTKTLEGLDAGILTVDATAAFTAIGTISGNYNQATGALDTTTLDVKATLSVYPEGEAGNEEQLLGRCTISPVPLALDTTGSLVDDGADDMTPSGDDVTYASAPFVPGPGAGVATWADLPNSVAEFEIAPGLVCPNVDGLVDGPGGLWLSGTAAITADPVTPSCANTPSLCPVTDPPPAPKPKKCKKGFKKKGKKCVKAKKKKK